MLFLRTARPMIRHIAFVVLLAALAMPVTAKAASLNGNSMMNKWAASDRCAAAAHKAFPDFTAESNAKRDAAMKNCLASQNLPPHGDLDPKF
jgi:hypothetical protein